jgi:tetratricopeptide (TPR) repeat protein
VSPGSAKAAELYRQALAIDPGYAPAWNGLSVVYIVQTFAGLLPWHQGWEMVRAAAEEAVRADPRSARALALLGKVAARYDVDFEAAAGFMERAYRLFRGEEVLTPIAGLLNTLGRTEEAIRIERALLERDPLNGKLLYNLSLDYYVVEDFQTADELLREALILNPDNPLAREWQAVMSCRLHRYPACLREFEELARLTGIDWWALVGRSLALYETGRREEAAEALATLERDFPADSGFEIARIHAWQGRNEQALDWLSKLFEIHGPSAIATVDNYPEFRALRDNPGYQALLEAAGVSQAQRAAVEFDIELAD